MLLARRGVGLLLPWRLSATCSADEILQVRLIDLVAFVDVYRAPGIPARIRVRAYEANPLECWVSKGNYVESKVLKFPG